MHYFIFIFSVFWLKVLFTYNFSRINMSYIYSDCSHYNSITQMKRHLNNIMKHIVVLCLISLWLCIHTGLSLYLFVYTYRSKFVSDRESAEMMLRCLYNHSMSGSRTCLQRVYICETNNHKLKSLSDQLKTYSPGIEYETDRRPGVCVCNLLTTAK